MVTRNTIRLRLNIEEDISEDSGVPRKILILVDAFHKMKTGTLLIIIQMLDFNSVQLPMCSTLFYESWEYTRKLHSR